MPKTQEPVLPKILRSTKHKTQSFKLCRCACKWRCQCLIPREKKPHPPFNVGADPDTIIGLHPKFYSGDVDAPPVGLYYPSSIKCKSTATNWTKQLQSAEFSATMGGRVLEKYAEERRSMKTGRGPGTHEILQWPDDILHGPCKNIKKDIGFGAVPLFKPAVVSTNPGPGYTRKCPYYYMEKREREGSSDLPTFEYDGLQPRFRTVSTSWSLPCNLYDVKHPDSMETFLKKVTGKRGPYDLFTGPRDDTTLVGYQASGKLEDRGDWPKALPSELDKLMQKSNYFKGLWTTCPRFSKVMGTRMALQDLALCYKDPKHPGPGHYNPRSPRKPRNTKSYPFDSNIEHAKPHPPSEIRPGPGRYTIKKIDGIRGHGWTWVFKSKAPRTDFIVIHKHNAF